MIPKLSPILASLGLLAIATPQAAAWWILGCGNPVVNDRIDPIVSPGKVPSAHLHTVMGGDAFASNMTYATTQTSRCTSCDVTRDLSNYWAPPLFFRHPNGSFVPVRNNGGMLVYYQQRRDPEDRDHAEGVRAFPAGFRMLAGDPSARRARLGTERERLETEAVSFACLGETSETSSRTNFLPNRKCKNGLRAQVAFPCCWDGVRLDSDDHRSHVAYPSRVDNGVCPDSHPKRLMFLFSEIVYSTDQFDHLWQPGGGSEQPFVFAHGDPTGYGYHADFFNGWDVPLLQRAIDSCGDETFGDIRKCAALEPYLQPAKAQNRCVKAPEVGEPGLAEVLPALPGCNPVQSAHPATMQTCAAATPTDVPAGITTIIAASGAAWARRMVRRGGAHRRRSSV